ncbi:hypothetical protein RND81_05G115800 [Saponaria officinalis]|uniref:Retrotransposon Copia-like N-terminal domain-containing protein n=1 Tax=Saponaria officinalis TaxID=3572 RepID=A0AAW1L058_SAPOF
MSSTSSDSDRDYQNPYDDPLYLSASDFPGMQLVNTLFNGHNYIHWSRGITLALGSKNKQGFLTRKTKMPDEKSAKCSQWMRCDYMIRCWILNSMNAGVKEGFMTAKSTKQLWNEIFERYGQSNGPLLYQLKKELRNITQDNCNVAEYFNKLKRNWDDIEELESIPECSCGTMEKCTCNILKKLLEAASKEKVLTFLMGLNESYDMLRTNILSMEPLPSINKVDAKRAKVDDRWCSFCKSHGHVKDNCFKLHPEQRVNYQSRNQKFSGQKYAANAIETGEETSLDVLPEKLVSTAGGSNSQSIQKFNPALVTAVYQHMMSIIQSGTSTDYASTNFAGKILASNAVSYTLNDARVDWIVDSGATDHMSAQKKLFLNLRRLTKPILVGLPDGTTKAVSQVDEIQIHPQIMLHEDHDRHTLVTGLKEAGLYKIKSGQGFIANKQINVPKDGAFPEEQARAGTNEALTTRDVKRRSASWMIAPGARNVFRAVFRVMEEWGVTKRLCPNLSFP